jgi:hypothetical protein
MSFIKDLSSLLNEYCVENSSDTPDFLLAEYMLASLNAYERITQGRDAWYGMNPRPGVDWQSDVQEPPRFRRVTDPETGGFGDEEPREPQPEEASA